MENAIAIFFRATNEYLFVLRNGNKIGKLHDFRLISFLTDDPCQRKQNEKIMATDDMDSVGKGRTRPQYSIIIQNSKALPVI